MNSLTIVEPDDRFDFSKINLGALTRISGETYYARIYLNNAPLFIQTPKSLTKQGFVKTGKKMHSDLMFTNQDEKLINWVEHLESRCQQLIYEKKSEWFTGDESMELNDIEGAFTSMLKLYKSGKYYLIRANVKNNVKIFDENVNSTAKMTCEDINGSTNMITVIEIQGVKFVSKNFQIELEIKQCMVVSPDPFSDNCFIKHLSRPTQGAHPPKTTVDQIVDEFINEQTHNYSAPKLNQGDLQKPLEIIAPVLNEEDETKRNTELNSITTSTVPVKKLPPNHGDDDDEDEALMEIHIGDEVTDNAALGIIEIGDNLEPIVVEPDIKEVDLKVDNNSLETISLKRPNQVYYDIYKEARKKAKEMKHRAVLAYLEAKNIKKTYMLEDIEDSDSDSGDSDGAIDLEEGSVDDEDSESDFDDLSIVESDGE
jgi:hypothetical protein